MFPNRIEDNAVRRTIGTAVELPNVHAAIAVPLIEAGVLAIVVAIAPTMAPKATQINGSTKKGHAERRSVIKLWHWPAFSTW